MFLLCLNLVAEFRNCGFSGGGGSLRDKRKLASMKKKSVCMCDVAYHRFAVDC